MKKRNQLIRTAFIIIVIASLVIVSIANSAAASDRPVYLVELTGAITAGQNSFLHRQVENALEVDAQLIVIQMDTPGGLVDATLKINQLFLNAPVPIAVLVAPSGAIAGSAGAFILISSDIAAMAPGTTVGAAQPIAFSPEGAEPANEKTVIFYASHLRSMALEKGRPADIAERFVTENLTLDAREALELGVIEYLAGSVDELLNALDGVNIEKQGVVYNLNTDGAAIIQEEMNFRERLQNWLSDPQISFMILMLGILGIYFGLSAPGTIVPETAGLILLILGIYGIGMFDTNTTGIILLILGVGLLVAEIFTSGFGILGIGGALSLVAGAVLLPMEPLMAREWYATFLVTVVGATIGLLIILIFIAQRVIQSRKRWRDGSEFFNPPDRGITMSELNPDGMIRARGEIWRAKSEDGRVIPPGTEVRVVKAESLKLWVMPKEDKDQDPKGD
ncbi:MAG: nodulation protein NfeD [Bacillota bacterium]|nr:nodulation protein NfeD [Bacillota bacterium]